MVAVRSDLSRTFSPTPLLMQVHSEQAAQDHIHVDFKYVQRRYMSALLRSYHAKLLLKGSPSSPTPLKNVDYFIPQMDDLWFRLQNCVTSRMKDWWRAKLGAELTCQSKSNTYCLVSQGLWAAAVSWTKSWRKITNVLARPVFLWPYYRSKEEPSDLTQVPFEGVRENIPCIGKRWMTTVQNLQNLN